MYAWKPETGANFNLKIAAKITKGAFDNLIARAPDAHTGVLICLGDLVHADTKRAVTEASGHLLDVDSRWQRVMKVTLETFEHAIYRLLAKHEKVVARFCEGNHDPQASFNIATSIAEHFRNEPRVTIDLCPANYWYFSFGKTLLGATHGHKCKTAKLPSIMAAMVPKWWGRSNCRVQYQGHLHHMRTEEFNGCVVHVMQTLAPADAYAAGAGYLSGRSMALDIYHRRVGFLTRHLCPATQAEAAARK